MFTLKSKAAAGALIAFKFFNPNATEEDWERRNSNAISEGQDDWRLIIDDCMRYLTMSEAETWDTLKERVKEAWCYYTALDEIVDELAWEEEILSF